MNDFNTWFEGHVARFSLQSYIAKDPTMVDDWRRELASFDLQDLNFATREMMLGDMEIWPKDHLRLIRQLADKNMRNRRIVQAAPEQTFHNSYRCERCRDSGTIRILAAQVKPKDVVASSLIDCQAACTCKQGQRMVEDDREKVSQRTLRRGIRSVKVEDYRFDYGIDWETNVASAVGHYQELGKPSKFNEFEKFAG